MKRPPGVRARRRAESAEGWNVPPEGSAWQESQSRSGQERSIHRLIPWNVMVERPKAEPGVSLVNPAGRCIPVDRARRQFVSVPGNGRLGELQESVCLATMNALEKGHCRGTAGRIGNSPPGRVTPLDDVQPGHFPPVRIFLSTQQGK